MDFLDVVRLCEPVPPRARVLSDDDPIKDILILDSEDMRDMPDFHTVDLPAALLPPDWPGQHVGATLNRAFQVFGPLLEDYFATDPGDEASRAAPHQTGRTQRTA